MSDFRIVPGSCGSFLCPPGHPMLTHELQEFASPRARTVQSIYALDYALEHPHTVGEDVHRRARRLYDDAELVMSELWLRMVYGYFRNCYAPEDGSRDVSRAVSSGPPERHLAHLTVAKYFPHAEPRLDLIEKPGNGYCAQECIKCGMSVQYEAQHDALAIVALHVSGSGRAQWSSQPVCTDGGPHTIAK